LCQEKTLYCPRGLAGIGAFWSSRHSQSLFWGHGSILGGSLRRSLGMAKFQERCNHPHPDKRHRDEAATPYRATNNVSPNPTYLNHAVFGGRIRRRRIRRSNPDFEAAPSEVCGSEAFSDGVLCQFGDAVNVECVHYLTTIGVGGFRTYVQA